MMVVVVVGDDEMRGRKPGEWECPAAEDHASFIPKWRILTPLTNPSFSVPSFLPGPDPFAIASLCLHSFSNFLFFFLCGGEGNCGIWIGYRYRDGWGGENTVHGGGWRFRQEGQREGVVSVHAPCSPEHAPAYGMQSAPCLQGIIRDTCIFFFFKF